MPVSDHKITCLGILKNKQICSPGALHILGPRDPKHLHELGALAVCSLTESATWESDPAVLHAHGSVEGTQERSEVPGAFQIHHRMKWLEKKKENSTATHSSFIEHFNTEASGLSQP